jgi:membrane-bound inhibitor of C-type lysozyme
MGNRATITLASDTKDRGIYITWNGGPGSVAAFVEETRKRMATNCQKLFTNAILKNDRETKILTFYTTLYGVMREFFNYYCNDKSRVTTCVYLPGDIKVRDSVIDNGCYIIEDDFTCQRINLNEIHPQEQTNYQNITRFFEAGHHALSTIIKIDALPPNYKEPDVSLEELQHKLEYAEWIETNAIRSVQDIRDKIDAKTAV